MKIAVIGDTHIPKRAKKLPEQLKRGLESVDLILHTGDWQTLDVYKELVQFAPVDGVAGNVDGDELIKKFGKRKLLQFQHVTIGLTHGNGKGKTTEKRALEMFQEDSVDIIIYGHSHIPVLKKWEDITLFNPGSPTDKRRQTEYSYGIIDIMEPVSIKHVFFSDKT
ncbi:metallophosphoesterase family protein [Terrihalobacillus insolitus]|uniref:metallophosphoesterase family protein n=1 Tax=Terrihalobacillus insolitus TaxID=2950438 RepID=UPI002340A4CF|nr:metallophosphoesterase [Terrihalobacillus insolitus]MDC3413573.1 metallophosphoesterase [Terrihalobacillus insolitus]